LPPSDSYNLIELEVVMYTRASASDYDDWESVYDNPGWGSKDLIPLLKKVSLGIHSSARTIPDYT
jgi:hypothetical protein